MPKSSLRHVEDGVPTDVRGILATLDDQANLLKSIAAGHRRDAEVDREYRVRAYVLTMALRPMGLGDPFGYRDLAAWVADCALRLPDIPARHAHIDRMVASVRAAVQGHAPAVSRRI